MDHSIQLLHVISKLETVAFFIFYQTLLIDGIGIIDQIHFTERAPVVVDKDITHDGKHPSFQIFGMRKFLMIIQCLQYTILN